MGAPNQPSRQPTATSALTARAVDLQVDFAGIKLRNPILTASGTCGYGPEYAEQLDYRQLGGFTTKSVTRELRPGNDPQRIVEVSAGILNAIGLANVGLERFVTEKLPFIREMDTPVLVNVAGHSVADYVTVAERLGPESGIAGLELNVSCPNVADGLQFGTDPNSLEHLVQEVRRAAGDAKLIVKLSPNVTDISATARAAIAGGADGLSLINTYVGMHIDIHAERPSLSNLTGGLSGPAIRPLAVYALYHVYREVARDAGIPLLGMGGVRNAADVIEMMLAGASAVAVGTALFSDPSCPEKMSLALAEYCARSGRSSVRELTGLAHAE